jgi:hypothetical protein
MDKNGQLHDTGPFIPWKEPFVPIGKESGWVSEEAWML